MTTVDEFMEGVYRLATFDDRVGMSFNQYLIRDDKTTLVHTGSALMLDGVLESIRKVVDPAEIAYIFISHFEADECGGLARLRTIARKAVPVGSAVTARQLSGFGICSDTLVQKEGDILSLGRRSLRFIGYPSEMHLWEGLLALAEPDRILFTSDLFIRRGPTPDAMVKANPTDVLDIAPASIPSDAARAACLDKIRALDPRFLALGHGPVLDLRKAQPAG